MKLLTLITALLLSSFIYGQQVLTETDDMTGETSYKVDKPFLERSTERNELLIHPAIGENREVNFFIVMYSGVRDCNEKNTLIIKFEDDSIIKGTSFSKFNCDATAAFIIEDQSKLKTLKIEKIRFENGRSYEQINVEVSDKEYFINFYENL